MRSEGAYDSLLGAIYQSALSGAWSPALRQFRHVIDVAETSLCAIAAGSCGQSTEVLSLETSRNLHTAETENRVVRHFVHLDPKSPIFANHGAGFLFNDARHFDETFVAHDTFYQECVLPLGTRRTLDLILHKRDDRTTYLAAMRPGSAFSRREEDRFLRISQHFRRALLLKVHAGEAERAAQQAEAALDRLSFGVLTLDETGRMVFANTAARTLLSTNGELYLRQSRLQARSAGRGRILEAMIGRGVTGRGPASVLRVPAPSGGEVFVWCVPLPSESPLSSRRPGALVVLRSSGAASLEIGSHDLATLYGLTRAEAELALALGRGLKLREIATRRGTSLPTVRTQLHWTLQKMGLATQADLTRTLASIARPVSDRQ